MSDYRRRFVINDATFAQNLANAPALTEAVLATSPRLVKMTETIRGYSKLITSLKYLEVYHTITNDTDFEIALLLLAAKKADGSSRYTQEQVQAMLWGYPELPGYSEYADGITEISCKFAASKFIIAFAILANQYEAADKLRKQAEQTLEYIIKTQEASTDGTKAGADGEINAARFYFERISFTLDRPLQTSFYLPGPTSASWILAKEYPAGTYLTTETIAGDLALAINGFTLNPIKAANVIAAVAQSGYTNYPYIDFAIRNYQWHYNADLVSIRIEFPEAEGAPIPFKWGVELNNLKQTNINSVLLILRSPKDSKYSNLTPETNQYNVLYFRAKEAPLVSTPLSYRLSVTEDTIRTVLPPATTIPRYSQQALGLLNSLQELKETAKLIGSIVRDDPPTLPNPVSAVQLIGWATTTPIVQLVLDILTVPEDIEVALGDRDQPKTSFSSLPISAICETVLQSDSGSTNVTAVNQGAALVSLGKSPRLTSELTERIRHFTGFDY